MLRILVALGLAFALAGCAPAPVQISQSPDATQPVPFTYDSGATAFAVMPRP